MIYGRFGNIVTIVRRGTLADVKTFDHRSADKYDRQHVKSKSYVIVKDAEDGRESLYHLAYLRADDGSKEIDQAIEEVSK
jgi:hypothetical protein